MINSIHHFGEKGIRELEAVIHSFVQNPTDISSLVLGVQQQTLQLALDILAETFEDYDNALRQSGKRKQTWQIVRQDKKSLITSIGEITFQKTLFKNKETSKSEYLLDRIMGLDSHERITEDASVQMLEEALESSYRKGSEKTSLLVNVSKETVKNKIHELKFPHDHEAPEEKKQVEYLYIDADEAHVFLQFREKKSDLKQIGKYRKNNCQIAKLVYVYEGVEAAAPKSQRKQLIHPHYFSGIYKGTEENNKLWDEVYDYIESRYDIDSIKKIYLNSDAGEWIKAGKSRIAGVVHVLDEFHINKYLTRSTSHLLDKKEDIRKELIHALRNKGKKEVRAIGEKILNAATTEAAAERVSDSICYLTDNITAVRRRIRKEEGVIGCSAEGHVSHVLSSRMSARPLGWSIKGVDQMAHLRAYYWNKGDLLTLVRFQKREVPLAAGGEEMVLTVKAALDEGSKDKAELRKYFDIMTKRISTHQSKKRVWFNSGIWGL